jgi:Ca2+-binding EF-hand superfamily protein
MLANDFDLIRACYPFDKDSISTLDPKTFKGVIQEYCPNFPEEKLDELVEESPKNKKGHIQYRELAFQIEVIISNILDAHKETRKDVKDYTSNTKFRHNN